jgi:hypothetical protein
MATTYCSVDDLTDAGISPAAGLDAEELIRRAEKDIDNAIGPLPIGSNGRKYDPSLLSDFQRDALKYATLAQAAFRVAQGEEAMAQTDEYLPQELQPYRRAGAVSRQAMAELVGVGLLIWSGTLATTT